MDWRLSNLTGTAPRTGESCTTSVLTPWRPRTSTGERAGRRSKANLARLSGKAGVNTISEPNQKINSLFKSILSMDQHIFLDVNKSNKTVSRKYIFKIDRRKAP